jgi:pSer/pThr/pTyr-binding forkhead associated (FHA) protein
MEPIPVSAPELSDDAPPATLGELIVQNGRLRGTRRGLPCPLTLIGRDPACDFHLNVDGVQPLHCALVHSPTGLLLRNLTGDADTIVNGESVQTCSLQHGDVLTIGPFQFSLHLPTDDEPASAELQAERDALRIQAAAVAAQQADLGEQEAQLQRRRKALERQKEQLASHLEERRQQLLELREQSRKDRAAIKAETETARRQNEEVHAALKKEREAVQKELQLAGKERRRLIELRKRLRKRWRKHWSAHESVLERRAQELKAEQTNLECETAKLQRERVQLMQAQLRFNGEVELGRRRLQDEWQQLGLAQQQWEACLNQEQSERTARLRQLDRRGFALAEAEQKLSEQRRQMEQLQLHLRKEAEGLETRIHNQRLKLLEYDKQLTETASKRPAVAESFRDSDCAPSASAPPRPPDVPCVLARLADDLSDQRRHLLEQWQCLLKLYEAWEPERSAVVVQFEKAARELVLVEQRLEHREQAILAGEKDLCRRHQALFDVRCSLEAWQARLTARETFLDNERVMLLADVRANEQRTESQMKRLEEMRQRRARRRGQEIEELREARAQHEQMRRDYVLLWQECQDRRAELIRERRELSAKSLAVEQLRQELLGRTEDTPAADKRLERLHRRHLTRLEEEERDLKRERAALIEETKRLDSRGGRLIRQEEALVDRHENWMQQVADWEDQQSAAADLEQHRQQELQRWQSLHERDEQQLTALREEVERIARLLLEESETIVPPANRAA